MTEFGKLFGKRQSIDRRPRSCASFASTCAGAKPVGTACRLGEQLNLRHLTAWRGGEVLHMWSAIDLDAWTLDQDDPVPDLQRKPTDTVPPKTAQQLRR